MPLPFARVLVLTAILTAVTGCDSSTQSRVSGADSPSARSSAGPTAPAATLEPSPIKVRLGPPPPKAVPAGVDKLFEITFAEGKAGGDTGPLRIPVGDSVSIVVRSLRADTVHLHGYDVSARVNASQPGVVNVTANKAGAFELELERLGLQLATLQVQ